MYSNVVGYQKLTLQPGFNLVGAQFLEIGQAAKDIQQLFSTDGNTLSGYGDGYESHTQLLTWTPSDGTSEGQYTFYEWSADGEGTAISQPEQDAKWLTQGGEAVAEVQVSVGKAFWIQTDAAATVVTLGEVKSESTGVASVVPGFNLLSNPYPEAIDIQSIVPSSSIPGYGDAYESSTQLLAWTPSDGTSEGQYTFYEWSADGEGSAISQPEQDAKWLTLGGETVATDTIPAGAGFWINTTGSGTLTFTK